MDGANTLPLARCMKVKAIMPERISNLVVSLPQTGTAKRITDTGGTVRVWSGAVSPLIGSSLRRSDVDSTNDRSMRPTLTMPGIRTSTTATRTTITSRMPAVLARSADCTDSGTRPTFEALVCAYFDCRKNKRNSPSALAFEANLERNLAELYDDLLSGEYQPGRSICFVVTHPKAREVWAADFRDRIVHHLLYNHISPRFYRSFIADSCACIPGRGTLYAAERLEAKIRSITQNWALPASYLKCDLANFFVSIDKHILRRLLAARVTEQWWLGLTDTILFHDPRENFEYRGAVELLGRVPAHKRLTSQPASMGLPIGNLSSQFFANVLLDKMDQFIKHRIGAKHYIRYVDDFVLLHESPQWLYGALREIDAWLPSALGVRINPRKTILQPVSRGVDFVGQVIRPWRRHTRKRVLGAAIRRVLQLRGDELRNVANSYFGLLGQSGSGHSDQAKLARAVLHRGNAVSGAINKAYGKINHGN